MGTSFCWITCGSKGFPRGGSCQRPRPLTDEGEPCHYCPQIGYCGKAAPHPALRGHLPPKGKASELLGWLRQNVRLTAGKDQRLLAVQDRQRAGRQAGLHPVLHAVVAVALDGIGAEQINVGVGG